MSENQKLAERLSDFVLRARRIADGTAGLSTQGAAAGLAILVTMNLEVLEQAAAALRERAA